VCVAGSQSIAGGGPETLIGPKLVGAQWNQFGEVFSTGQGQVCAVTPTRLS